MKKYAITIFLSAFLAFQVQPLISKYILPWFGGSSSVWLICLLFFQIVLLLAYAYAFLIVKFFNLRWQKIIHSVFLISGLLVLPIIPSESLKPISSQEPVTQIILLLTLTVGLPFFLVASTSPLLQDWFSRSAPRKSPYPLYAISNFGSLLALVSFPFFFEPIFARKEHAQSWSALFVLFVIASLFVIYKITEKKAKNKQATISTKKPTTKNWFYWIALPFLASAMLLGITNQLCLNVAAVPFLWILPLSIYLITFILSFSSFNIYKRKIFIPILILATLFLPAFISNITEDAGIISQIILFSVILFSVCLIAHSELYKIKPAPQYLTSFYLALSIGGALGGIFVGIIAPLIFTLYWEVHLLLFLTVFIIFLLYSDSLEFKKLLKKYSTISYYALGICSLIFALSLFNYQNDYAENATSASRNFYGTLSVRVQEAPGENEYKKTLLHGTIIHGYQFISPEKQSIPTSYYGNETGVGLAFNIVNKKENIRVGVIGLGTGTISAYGKKGDFFKYYEINPAVIELATNEFSYIKNSPANHELALGDARLTMDSEQPQSFDLLILDAFSSDAIPTHLLTTEAMKIYKQNINKDGIIAFHISNRYLDLLPVVNKLAHLYKMTPILIKNDKNETETFSATWVLLTTNKEIIEDKKILEVKSEINIEDTNFKEWTDDYVNLFSVFK
jgi:spermidine synthase